MDDYVSWLQSLPVSALFIALTATLALSLLGAPWLALAGDRRAEGSTSLLNRWRLFSWLHPIQAGFWKWTMIAAVAILVVWPSASAFSRSQGPALIRDTLAGLYRHVWKAG